MNTSKTQRIEALDIFRALTMFLMLFVNDIPGLKNIPHWLLHAAADEDMLGFSDIIFPGFLFAMGMAIPFAIESRIKKGDTILEVGLHIFWRTIALLSMGLFTVNLEYINAGALPISQPIYSILMVLAFFLIWSVYPKTDGQKKYLYTGMKTIGILLLGYLFYIYEGIGNTSFSTHWWGILGLIGWTYLFCAVIYLFTRKSLLYNTLVFLFLMIASIFSTAGVFKSCAVIGMIPAGATLCAFVMAGLWASLLMQKYADKTSPKHFYILMCSIGVVMLVAAIITHQYWIISKIQSTAPWLFYCCAIFFPLFVLIYWLTDIKGKSSWFAFIKPAGTVTLTCYIIPYAWYSVKTLMGVRCPDWLHAGIPGLIKSVVFSLLIIGLAWLLMKAKIRLKI